MNILDKIIAIFSPMMRSTLELKKLNGLWEQFNEGHDVLDRLQKGEWKYHQDKANLLINWHRWKDNLQTNQERNQE